MEWWRTVRMSVHFFNMTRERQQGDGQCGTAGIRSGSSIRLKASQRFQIVEFQPEKIEHLESIR